MLTLYWLCFATGGVFVLLATVGGFDGVDFDSLDGDVPFESDLEIAAPKERSPSSPLERLHNRLFVSQRQLRTHPLAIVSSLKFWTFGVCFFGLTGLVLSHLSAPLAAPLISLIAIAMGVICGAFVSGTLRILQNNQADSLVRADDVIGLTGIVTLPFGQNSRGKVQLQVKGSQVERIAYTDESQGFQLGDRVLVVGVERERIWVVSANSISLSADEH